MAGWRDSSLKQAKRSSSRLWYKQSPHIVWASAAYRRLYAIASTLWWVGSGEAPKLMQKGCLGWVGKWWGSQNLVVELAYGTWRFSILLYLPSKGRLGNLGSWVGFVSTRPTRLRKRIQHEPDPIINRVGTHDPNTTWLTIW